MIVGSWKVVVLDASNHLLHFYMLTDSLVTAAFRIFGCGYTTHLRVSNVTPPVGRLIHHSSRNPARDQVILLT